jgi:hypothetical protein
MADGHVGYVMPIGGVADEVALRPRLDRNRQTAAVYLKQLATAGVLEEVKAGREKLFINPRLMRLLTAEEPGDLSFPSPDAERSH